jgi:hypothetical protein
MKKITLSVTIVLCTFITIAQNKNKFILDLCLTPVGYSNILQKSTAGDKIENKAKYSYGIGVNMNFVLDGDFKFILQPSIASMGYMSNQGDFKGRVQYLVLPAVFEFLIRSGRMTIHQNGEVIGRGKYKKWVAGIGMYGASALYGKYQLSGGSKTSFKFGESATDNRSALDYGFVFHIGIINSDIKTMIQARLGKNNVIPDARVVGKSKMTTSSATWSIAVPLSKLKK